MGLLSPTQTIIRYQVEGAFEGDIINTVMAGLKENAMPEIPEENQEIMGGWVSFEKPYTSDFQIDPFVYGTLFLFSLRVDKKSIPAKALAQQMSLAVKARCDETGRDFLSKNEKFEIKELVTEKLLHQLPFVPTIHEVCWDYESKIIMFYSGQKAANELFETFFIKSFGLKVFRLFPYAIAAGNSPEEIMDRINELKPSGIGGAS